MRRRCGHQSRHARRGNPPGPGRNGYRRSGGRYHQLATRGQGRGIDIALSTGPDPGPGDKRLLSPADRLPTTAAWGFAFKRGGVALANRPGAEKRGFPPGRLAYDRDGFLRLSRAETKAVEIVHTSAESDRIKV